MYMCVSVCVLRIEPRASYMLGKSATSVAHLCNPHLTFRFETGKTLLLRQALN